MKKLLKFMILAVPVSLFLTVTACDKDDPEPEPTPTPTPEPEPDNPSTGTTDDYPYYSQFNIPSSEDNLGDALAFPGAEGGGMYVTGGRGGTVIHVTNLDNDGTGSFRAAVTSTGKRIVVFDVAGTIKLTKKLQISNGDLTILGQTAPGDGICIAYDQVQIDADNVIVRFIHFRCSDYGGNTDLNDSSDALWGRYHQNIILDHCTMSWSIDECASFYANKNFTMQWCMLYEGLNNSSYHDKDGHGYGGLWGGRNASFHHNLLAHNNSRNARIDHPGIYVNNGTDYTSTHRGNVDFRNNVIYNWGDNNTYGGEDGWFNIVGNYYKPGPASAAKNRQYIVDAYWYNTSSNVGSAYPELYLEDNYKTDGWDSSYTNGVMYHDQKSYSSTGKNPDPVQLSSPLSIKADDSKTCYVTTHSNSGAYSSVVKYAGPSLSRDDCDTRVASETETGGYSLGTLGIIDTMVGTDYFPELTGTADTDTDGDGMPDWFEDQFGLDANNASDATTKTLDKYGRYTNLEMYAHYLVKDIVTNQNASGTYTALD